MITRKTKWWTRSQRIRTVAQLPFDVAILETSPPPAYQRIAHEADRLRRLGLSFTLIAEALKTSDKTVAKAIAWLKSLEYHGIQISPGSIYGSC